MGLKVYDVEVHGAMTDGKGQVLPCDFALFKEEANNER